jgi:hypothetical protein
MALAISPMMSPAMIAQRMLSIRVLPEEKSPCGQGNGMAASRLKWNVPLDVF